MGVKLTNMAKTMLQPITFLLLTSISLNCAIDPKLPSVGSKPNVVVFMVDDLGIGDIGCYGNTTLPTPNVDRLAKEGVRMTQFLTAAAICTPSRAAFLTGRYPIRSGMGGIHNDMVSLYTASATGLPASEVTFAELLKEAGYRTALIGKWHLGLHRYWVGDNIKNPINQGFDYWFGIPLTNLKDFDDGEKAILQLAYPNFIWIANVTAMTALLTSLVLLKRRIIGLKLAIFISLVVFVIPRIPITLSTNMKLWNSMLYRNSELVEQPINFNGLTQRLVEEGLEILEERHKDKEPFLLFMSFLQVHTVLHAGPAFQGTSKHGAYGDEVIEMDWSVGQILQALDRLGMTDNTMVLFTSDHGGHVEERGKNGDRQGGHNGIFRGGKVQGGMDGGIRVPGIIRWPGKVVPGTVINDPISAMDFLPTVAEAAGVELPNDRVIDGVSLLPVLTDHVKTVEGRDYLIHYCSDLIHAVRFKTDQDGAVWKVRYITPKWLPGTEGCGFVCFCGTASNTFHDPPLVFDMTSDPREANPLLSHDNRAKQLVKAAAEAIEEHRNTFDPNVEIQLTPSQSFFRPWLMPCCNFPYCSCEDKKQYRFKSQG